MASGTPKDPIAEDGHTAAASADRRALAALLDFYLAAGVDTGIEELAYDAFTASEPAAAAAAASASSLPQMAESPSAASMPAPAAGRAPLPGYESQPAPRPPVAGTHQAVLPDDEAIVAARDAARSAASLEELKAVLARFEACNLRLTAKSLVFADGNPDADVMFIGEAPGREEDRQGVPFVGRSGQLLDRMLAAIGLDRSSAYITNVVPWRPPGNRTPSPQETEICKPFILRQIELVAPKVLVFLGGASAKALTGAPEGILRLRGKWLDMPLGAGRIRAMATLHPAYLLRTPAQKRYAWRDFLEIRAALDAAGAVPTDGASE
ncbi:uracil-DNA glycosylase [Stappia taiwanensis]|uniref:uracil-DNA glycosylase n=1 Tax=Stappia taiwanensis TaxID=992267 RepID=UPI001666F7F2|nr:uracil-DNA glycosylase [Stappia taiwanensis]GGE92203.1 uracil-DNA glycosylase [Stappia taiwanensis]